MTSVRISEDDMADFSDLESLDKLFSKTEIASVIEFFDLTDDYNDCRSLYFGACMLLLGRTDVQCIHHILPKIQADGAHRVHHTDAVLRGKLLVSAVICKVDPASPATSSKTCGSIQTSSDVAIESIMSDVRSKAACFNHHPLILPGYMLNNHYS